MALSPLFHPVSFDEVPGWRDDDKSQAFAAFRRSACRFLEKPYRSGSLGVEAGSFATAYAAALNLGAVGPAEADAFFVEHFRPALIAPKDGGRGFVTGFYEPEVEASPVATGRFTVPLLSRPDDLIDIDETNRPAGFDSYFAFGRQADNGIVEYYDRAAIEQGALDGCGLEIAWLADRVDAFFIHVQGAARLKMTDGTIRRVTYAAKTGHRFTGAGRVLADLGEIPPGDVTMQSIRMWFGDNPGRVNEILWQNRSYIFFREAPVPDESLGPIAAAKVQLTPGRSVAVDRLLHTFGTPFFIDSQSLLAFDGAPFRRLMIAQDTGSAITGPARGDLFAGSGRAAGEIAGVIRHPADFYALLPLGLFAEQSA
ncbi:murein transglycosylase A [Mesorhizobium sp. BAC0120]|uniref:murein transglycosylase A n=1 Tax=Mesorhizobium sp. BAC0120 TaxID=3090670 RepID=UPI00298C7AF2|nr:murein transglycosylase A [Mesorhizobium sp. BAC0120]MDW6024499.1 murein transglycosylase A [Mesorhizobium sp. BAC0120]